MTRPYEALQSVTTVAPLTLPVAGVQARFPDSDLEYSSDLRVLRGWMTAWLEGGTEPTCHWREMLRIYANVVEAWLVSFIKSQQSDPPTQENLYMLHRTSRIYAHSVGHLYGRVNGHRRGLVGAPDFHSIWAEVIAFSPPHGANANWPGEVSIYQGSRQVKNSQAYVLESLRRFYQREDYTFVQRVYELTCSEPICYELVVVRLRLQRGWEDFEGRLPRHVHWTKTIREVVLDFAQYRGLGYGLYLVLGFILEITRIQAQYQMDAVYSRLNADEELNQDIKSALVLTLRDIQARVSEPLSVIPRSIRQRLAQVDYFAFCMEFSAEIMSCCCYDDREKWERIVHRHVVTMLLTGLGDFHRTQRARIARAILWLHVGHLPWYQLPEDWATYNWPVLGEFNPLPREEYKERVQMAPRFRPEVDETQDEFTRDINSALDTLLEYDSDSPDSEDDNEEEEEEEETEDFWDDAPDSESESEEDDDPDDEFDPVGLRAVGPEIDIATFTEVTQTPANEDCSICMENFDPNDTDEDNRIVKLRCNHCFHALCLSHLVNGISEYSTRCPNCRLQICEPRAREPMPDDDSEIADEDVQVPVNEPPINAILFADDPMDIDTTDDESG